MPFTETRFSECPLKSPSLENRFIEKLSLKKKAMAFFLPNLVFGFIEGPHIERRGGGAYSRFLRSADPTRQGARSSIILN